MAKNSGLLFRMESMDAAAAGGDADESLAITADASQAVEEVESATGDVTEVDTGIENAQEAQGELTAVTDLVSEAVEDGDGLSPREAAHVEARLEHIASLLGTTAAGMGLTFRRESFGGSASRLAATKMRLEAMKEWGSKIWEAIKKGWEWLKDAVTNLITKITGNVDAVEKRLKDLAGRVAAIGDADEKKETKMKSGAKAFSIGNATTLETVKKIIATVSQNQFVMMGLADATHPDNKPGAPTEAVSKVKKIVGAYPAVTGLPTGTAEGSIAFGNFIGGKTLILSPSNKSVSGSEVQSFSFEFGSENEKLAEDYTAFSKAELTEISKVSNEACAALKDLKKAQSGLEKSCQMNIKFCEDSAKNNADMMTKTAKDDDGKKEVSNEKEGLIATANFYSSATKAIFAKLPQFSFSTVIAAADLIEAGIGNFKKKEAKK